LVLEIIFSGGTMKPLPGIEITPRLNESIFDKTDWGPFKLNCFCHFHWTNFPIAQTLICFSVCFRHHDSENIQMFFSETKETMNIALPNIRSSSHSLQLLMSVLFSLIFSSC